MPLRRVLAAASGALAIVGIAGGAIGLSAGPVEHVSSAYSAHRTFVSQQAGMCVDATVRGTAVATRTGTAPLVRWTDVRLLDPVTTAVGYAVAAGRCDRSHPIRLGATLEQRWSAGGGADRVLRSDEGPTTGPLRQFNSGAPVDLPDRGFPATVLAAGYGITGRVLVDAESPSGGEAFSFPVHLDLVPARG